MGLDPDDDNYPNGTECTVCVDELFDGVTPDCVLAIVEGIERCPGAPPDLPNGAYQLRQLPSPCVWQFFDGLIGVTWQLKSDRSIMFITKEPQRWFGATVMNICHDAFANENVCGVAGAIGLGGKVTLFWGPQICKGPCE